MFHVKIPPGVGDKINVLSMQIRKKIDCFKLFQENVVLFVLGKKQLTGHLYQQATS